MVVWCFRWKRIRQGDARQRTIRPGAVVRRSRTASTYRPLLNLVAARDVTHPIRCAGAKSRAAADVGRFPVETEQRSEPGVPEEVL